MKRIKKLTLMIIRAAAYRGNRIRTYYWAEGQLQDLQAVSIMPDLYYRWLFRVAMRLVRFDMFRKLADQAIHTIPYHVRFNLA